MRGIHPPLDGKINGPDSVEDMICEEHVGKVEHVFRVLLRGAKCERRVEEWRMDELGTNVIDGADTPRESDEGEGRVYIQGELSSVATCSGEQGNEAVNTSDLVENLITYVNGRERLKLTI
jgi:hypothetical protein